MFLDIIFALIFFGLGSFQGWCMARRGMRRDLGPAFELAEMYATLSEDEKSGLHDLMKQGTASDGQRDQ